jgi:hypothetical protein
MVQGTILLPKKSGSSTEIFKKLGDSLEKRTAKLNFQDKLSIPPIDKSDNDRIFPLDSEQRNQFELIYAIDFSKVQIHLGEEADRLARDRGASAVTRGNDIYFRSDQYAPHSDEGQKLMAHELQHVLQFQENQTMGTAEDVRTLEYAAEKVEETLSTYNLFALRKPLLSKDSQVGDDDLAGDLQQAVDGTASQSDIQLSDESLESFSGKKMKTGYRIHLTSGDSFVLNHDEYQILMDKLEEKFKEHIENKRFTLSLESYVDYVQMITDKIKQGVL